MPHPLAFVYPMPPCSVIVFGVESGDQLAHTDTSSAPHILPPSHRSKSDCHLSPFVALSPQVPPVHSGGNGLGGGPAGEVGRGLLNQGEVLIMVSTACHHGPPPPPRAKACKGPCSLSGPPTKSMPTCCPTPPTSTPPRTRRSRNFWGRLSSRRSPHMANSFFLGGWEAHLGLAVEDLQDDVLNPLIPAALAAPPRVHPPPHLRHPLRGRSPPRAGPWLGGGPLAGAVPAGVGEGRADGRTAMPWCCGQPGNGLRAPGSC